MERENPREEQDYIHEINHEGHKLLECTKILNENSANIGMIITVNQFKDWIHEKNMYVLNFKLYLIQYILWKDKLIVLAEWSERLLTKWSWLNSRHALIVKRIKSGTGFTQPREDNWVANWLKNIGSG